VTPPLRFVPKGTVYRDDEEKIRLETRNGIIQAEYILHEASIWVGSCRFSPEVILELQRLAVNQIYRCAGHFRDGPVVIGGGTHRPPDHSEVVTNVQAMCDYVNRHWQTPGNAVHLSAYVMWRLNWIHPFFGGNGRSSRAASYLVLCARLGFLLPGVKSIPDLIVANREPYYAALRSADRACESGGRDVSAMEDLLSSLLAQQLVSFHELATGRQPNAHS
jgi:Fic family protein